MAKIIEVNYYNCTILKGKNYNTKANTKYWHIEESRIKGGFNDISMDFGVKAHIVDPDYKEDLRDNALIFSGIYNPRTGVNETNEFSTAEEITKEVDTRHGSIQKLHAENTNLNIFQEEKINMALVNKDAVFSASGQSLTTSSAKFIGQIVPYIGNYGISKNPESFAYYGGNKYFADKNKGLILKLDGNNISEISSNGMRSFFRNNLIKADKIYGMWDAYDKKYIVHAEGENLITNGDFGNGTANWTFVGDVSVSSNKATWQETDETSKITQSNVFEIGKKYRIYYKIEGYIEGGLKIRSFGDGTTSTDTDLIQENGSSFIEGIAGKVDFEIKRKDNPTTLSMDNISITEVDNAMNNIASTTTMPGNVNSFTVGFDEGSKGWISFYTFFPKGGGGSINNNFYTFDNTVSHLWEHYSSETRNTFRGSYNDSIIDFVFNSNPSLNKSFNAINYEGSDTWNISNIESDTDTGANIISYDVNNENLIISAFKKFYNKYFSNIINISSSAPNEVIFGDDVSGIKGFFMKLKIKTSSTALKELFAVSTNYNNNT